MCVNSYFLHFPFNVFTKYVVYLHNVILNQKRLSSFSLQLNVCFPTMKQGVHMLFSQVLKSSTCLASRNELNCIYAGKIGMDSDDGFWFFLLLFGENNYFGYFGFGVFACFYTQGHTFLGKCYNQATISSTVTQLLLTFSLMLSISFKHCCFFSKTNRRTAMYYLYQDEFGYFLAMSVFLLLLRKALSFRFPMV